MMEILYMLGCGFLGFLIAISILSKDESNTEPINDYDLAESLKDELDDLYIELAEAKEYGYTETAEGISSKIKIRELMLSKIINNL